MAEFDSARGDWIEVLLSVVDSYRPSMPWAELCRTLAAQLDAPVAGDFGWDDQGLGLVRAYPMPTRFDLARVARRAPVAHALARHYAANRTCEVLATDMVPAYESIDGREYVAELKECGIDQQLWIPVTFEPDGPRVIGVCRPGRPFSAHEVRVARLAQRVAVTVRRHVRSLSGAGAVGWPDRAVELRLTPRQVAVLRLAAAGLTSASIGRRLELSPRTVERHLENAYERLKVHDRVTAIRRAESAGLLVQDVRVSPWSPVGEPGVDDGPGSVVR